MKSLLFQTLVFPMILVALVFSGATACVSRPPNLTPQATLAFHNTQVIKGLDLLRDIAIDANKQTPPLMATDSTRKVVLFHQSALNIIAALPNGWVSTVTAGLDAIPKGLSDDEQKLVEPYLALAKKVIQEVAQ